MTQQIDLGSVADVTQLFSFPNNSTGLIAQTLEGTVKHYLQQSIKRDGFSNFELVVTKQNDHILAEITGDAANAYASVLRPYLDIGMHAHTASQGIDEDGKWRYNWRFFLPHGVAMTRHRTVQLLHFPPDYVLEVDQDYLAAHTTLRWAQLLEENGVASQDTPQYQNIIDIAPIAAPAWDGDELDGVYSDYTEFIKSLLRLWVPSIDGSARPVVAFGYAVRKWIEEAFEVEDLSVLSLVDLKLSDDVSAHTLVANHPSYIYALADRLRDDPDTPEDERLEKLMRTMQQDLVAAKWQAEMGKAPNEDPKQVLDYCKEHWIKDPGQQQRVCELSYIQALSADPAMAACLCTCLTQPEPKLRLLTADEKYSDELDQRLAQDCEAIGTLDSWNPAQALV